MKIPLFLLHYFKMKFSIATLLSITVSTVYAQTTATTASTAGIAVNKPSFGVRNI